MVKINFPSNFQISLFLSIFFIVFSFVLYLLRNKKIFNRKIVDYTWAIKFYFLGAAIAVYLQYLATSFSQSGRIGQLLWQLIIVLSAVILVKKHKFNLKNIAFLGILYALWIHGAKCSLRYFVYGFYTPEIYKTFRYIAGRFIYGNVLAIAIAIGTFFALSLLNEVNKKQKDKKKIVKLVVWLILVVIILFVAIVVYGRVR